MATIAGYHIPLTGRWLEKGLSDAHWNQSVQLGQIGNISVRAANAQEKTLTPKQCYELSIAVRSAIGAITSEIAQARVRAIDRNGREIVAGPLYDFLRKPAPRMPMRKWAEWMLMWYNIAGETAARIVPGTIDRPIEAAWPLDPYRLTHLSPQIPNHINDITMWQYFHNDGTVDKFTSWRLAYDAMFNPNVSVRGLSPLITGSIEAGTGYAAARYRKNYFDNGAIPSNMLILGEGMSRQQREDITERYLSEFGFANNNSHKTFVVSGKDVKFERIQGEPQEGAFVDLSRWTDQQIALLYRVPPILMHYDTTTKFDNANEQRTIFVEKTLMPQMSMLSELLQYQIVDPYFSSVSNQTEKAVMTKAVETAYEQMRDERDGSGIIVFFDPDTLPIMAAVKAALIEQASKFKETLDMSANEVISYFKLDIPYRPERDDVWKDQRYLNITHPEFNEKIRVFTQNGPSGAGKTSDGNDEPEKKPKRDKDKDARVEKAVRTLRKLTLEGLDTDSLWSLEAADNAVADKSLMKAVRVIRHELKQAIANEPDKKDAAKAFFNALDPRTIVDSI